MNAFVRAGRGLRLLRAAVFAAACVALSAAGHAWASGAGIPAPVLAVAWCAVFAVAAALAGRERSLPGISALLAGAEAALHVAFGTGQWWCAGAARAAGARDGRLMALAARLVCTGGGGPVRLTPAGAEALVRRAGIDPAALPDGGAGAAHSAGAMSAMPGMDGMSGMGPMSYGWGMLLGHLAAALVAGWLLQRGEAALWRLVRLSADVAGRVARRLPWLARIAAALRLAGAAGAARGPARPVRRTRRERDGDGRPESVCLRHAVVRRGPPRWELAA